jgi:RimJ/RimL family protein N-acetyltransferase
MANKIYLKKYHCEGDFSFYWSLVSDKKIMILNYGRAFTMEEAQNLFNHMLEVNKNNMDSGYFKVFKTTTNIFIGLGGIILNEDLTQAEIEYMIFPDYWGKGYGSEIVEELLNKANYIETVKKVIAITDPCNKASKKILFKNGFVSEKIYEIDDGSLAEMLTNTI